MVRSSIVRSAQAEMMEKSLQQENDILRFQLNDLINREKNQVSVFRKPIGFHSQKHFELNMLINSFENFKFQISNYDII